MPSLTSNIPVRIQQLQYSLAMFTQKYSRVEGVIQSLQTQSAFLQAAREAAADNTVTYNSARALLEILVRSSEEHIKSYIEPIITEALQYVFCKEVFFHVIFAMRRNQIENDFILLRNRDQEVLFQTYVAAPAEYEKELEVLIKSSKELDFMNGGAVAQVLAAVLKLTIAELLEIQGPVCLDEPSSAIGAEYTSRFGQLLYSLSRKFNRQIVIITHSDTLASFGDIVYRIAQDSAGVSHAERTEAV